DDDDAPMEDDGAEEVQDRPRRQRRRQYKIQEVIKRRQVILVQVVKEERGNKGAALTTYLSLAGRYCVLMPNSSHGGGISRKISSSSDRKRLKGIIAELDLPKSMGCIVRTAGLSRTKTEIKRDFDYLARVWDEIREKTLGSSAPAMIHSDSDLVKRAIRDIYNRDIEEVIVEGESGYRAARDFMKLLMPSHVKKVKPYVDPVPLYQRYGAEDQLTAMYDPVVQLKSGGYIVINPTEALVSIDINSGRSTKEHGIEATALNTNLEAAREIARQLRLRDMAGLVVIDFIDMEYGSNVRKVEKAMKDALKNDRARIQVGRISSFGLMEMSRQRLRTGVLEASTRACPHCDGVGLVRTASSSGLAALRLIEDEAAKGRGTVITLYASTEASIYLLNTKRADLHEIEERYGVQVQVIPEGENEGAKMRVASSGPRPTTMPRFEPIVEPEEDDLVEEDYGDEDEEEEREDRGERGDREDRGDRNKRRRRRRGGKGRSRDGDREEGDREEGSDDARSEDDVDGNAGHDEDEETEGREDRAEGEGDGEGPRKRRRRGRRRRGGRGRGEEGSEGGSEETAGDDGDADQAEPVADEAPAAEEAAEEPAPKKRTRRKKADVEAEAVAAEAAPADVAAVAEEAPVAEKPKRSRKKKVEPEAEAEAAAPVAEPEAEVAAEPVAEAKPKRTRKKKADAEPAVGVEAEAEAQPEAEPRPAADLVDDAGEEAPAAGPARRGWWQRTFGE
ncbi:MAG: ribonuclease E/G, partial [Novosphingobium sp.]